MCRYHRPIKNKEEMKPLITKTVKMVNPVTGWFKITKIDDKKAMRILNIV